MSYDSLDERLSAYVDGQLPPAERDEIEALLRQQPDLAQAVEQMRQIGDGIRQLPRERLSPEFADRVLAAIEQTGAVEAPARRRLWLVAIGAIAAVAALAMAMVWVRPRPDQLAEQPALSPAEQAVAAVLEPAQEGRTVIIRLRMTRDSIRGKALDQALAAHGIAAAPATAINPAAEESAAAYQSLAENKPAEGRAADVLFIEAAPERLQKALAEVASSVDGAAVISSGGVVASTASGVDRLPKVEGESGTVTHEVKVEDKNYAQHLPPRGFPLWKSADENGSSPPPAAAGGRKDRVRVLVVVEVLH